MISSTDFRTGLTIEIEGGVWQVVEFQHVKPGKGAAFVRTKIKNVETGAVMEILMAKLYFRYGAMNCGKTTALLQTAHNYSESGQKAIIIKPAVDTKMKACVTSRLGIKREVDLLVNEELDLFEYFKNYNSKLDCILVDEVQFLTVRSEEHTSELQSPL